MGVFGITIAQATCELAKLPFWQILLGNMADTQTTDSLASYDVNREFICTTALTVSKGLSRI